MQEDAEGELDDFLDSIGMDTKPLSPEEIFMSRMSSDGRLAAYRYYIRHELFHYYDAEEKGWEMSLPKKNKETGVINRVKADKWDWIDLRTKYYLMMKHLPYFMGDIAGITKSDIDKVSCMLLEHNDIKPVIEANKEDLPRNGY